jgi:hypothetical protein
LKRQLSFPVSTISQWCVSRSSTAVVIYLPCQLAILIRDISQQRFDLRIGGGLRVSVILGREPQI